MGPETRAHKAVGPELGTHEHERPRRGGVNLADATNIPEISTDGAGIDLSAIADPRSATSLAERIYLRPSPKGCASALVITPISPVAADPDIE
jgi:hypothetical protein